MKIVTLNRRLKCDMPNCKNIAEYKIEKEGFFRSVGLNLCKDCVNDIYKNLAQIIVPKSPDNMLNKRIKTKENVREK